MNFRWSFAYKITEIFTERVIQLWVQIWSISEAKIDLDECHLV